MARVVVFLAAIAAVAGCTLRRYPTGEPGSEAYFLGFSGYDLPFEPTDPASRAEALTQRSYYRAEYDSSGRLVVLEKTLDGGLFFRHEYSYHPNGALREARVTNGLGDIVVHTFDESGEYLKTTEP